MVAGEIESQAWDQRGKAGDKVFRTEQDVCGSVEERVLELTANLAGGIG